MAFPGVEDFWHRRLPAVAPCGRGGTGRHTGLKILRGRPRAGSTPAVRTSSVAQHAQRLGSIVAPLRSSAPLEDRSLRSRTDAIRQVVLISCSETRHLHPQAVHQSFLVIDDCREAILPDIEGASSETAFFSGGPLGVRVTSMDIARPWAPAFHLRAHRSRLAARASGFWR